MINVHQRTKNRQLKIHSKYHNTSNNKIPCSLMIILLMKPKKKYFEFIEENRWIEIVPQCIINLKLNSRIRKKK